MIKVITEKIEYFLIKASSKKFLFYGGLSVIFLCLTIARRTEAIIDPQFYAEDGVFWYSEAYNSDNLIDTFLSPKQKYFQTISRIGASISMLFSIEYAPLIFNVLAIIITIIPALFFLSSRFDTLIPKISHRLFLSIVYLCIPGASEVHANLTNAHWHLALLMILVILSPLSQKLFWKIFDTLAMAISGLSGPFVFFGFPIFIIYLYYKRSKEKMLSLAVLAVTFFIQLYSFLFIVDPGAPRSSAPLDANILNFFQILTGNILLKGIIGPDTTREIRDFELWEIGIIPIILGILGLIILAYFFYKSNLEIRLFVTFLFLIFIAGLISPQASLTKPQWDVMASGSAGRYWYLPIIGWITALSFLFISEKNKLLKILFGSMLFCLLFIGIPSDFQVKKLKNYHFNEQVSAFSSLEKGEIFTFKIPPAGWSMTLIKK